MQAQSSVGVELSFCLVFAASSWILDMRRRQLLGFFAASFHGFLKEACEGGQAIVLVHPARLFLFDILVLFSFGFDFF